MKVSIIIPTFNSHSHIEKCILSAISQSYENIEIIIIDDGSTDNTYDKLKPILEKNKNISYIYQKNNGVSSARNTGIKHSKGKYIFFLDSDDWLSQNYINSILRNNEKYDLIINQSISDIYETKNIKWTIDKKHNDILMDIINTKIMKYSWGKLYKREIIEKHNIKFDEKIKVGEDALFNINYCLHINNYIYTNLECYFFYQHANSTTKKISYEHYQSRYQSIKAIQSNLSLYKKYNSSLNNLYIDYFVYYTLKKWCFFSTSEKNSLSPYIKKFIKPYYIATYLTSKIKLKRKIYFLYLLSQFKLPCKIK